MKSAGRDIFLLKLHVPLKTALRADNVRLVPSEQPQPTIKR